MLRIRIHTFHAHKPAFGKKQKEFETNEAKKRINDLDKATTTKKKSSISFF